MLKTAFVTADSKYQWNVVPFDLAPAVSTFQYLISPGPNWSKPLGIHIPQ